MACSCVISNKLLAQLHEAARAAYPEECCGLLVGRDVEHSRHVERLVPMANVAPPYERRRRFALDPLAFASVERALEGTDLKVVGIYHSHPDHPARPSETDRQAAWPYYCYVIVSVTRAGNGNVTSWMTKEFSGAFQPMDIKSTDAA